MLDPAPIAFTRTPGLDRARVVAALTQGRPETAMKSFATILTVDEIGEVADFVVGHFAACRAPNTAYHTPANGWPDHAARHGAAFPFATGEMAIDAPEVMLDTAQRAGLATFRAACISCHEGRRSMPGRLALMPASDVETTITDGFATVRPATPDDDHGGYDVPTNHDVAPALADTTSEEVRGAALYQQNCAACHAADGTGLNWIGRFLDPGPPDFTAPSFAAQFERDRFVRHTLDATPGGTMPSFAPVLTAAEVEAIAAYVARAFVSISASIPR